jgi:hypothetical protein
METIETSDEYFNIRPKKTIRVKIKVRSINKGKPSFVPIINKKAN